MDSRRTRPRNRGERRRRARERTAMHRRLDAEWNRKGRKPVWERDFPSSRSQSVPALLSPREAGAQLMKMLLERKATHGSGAIESIRKDIPYWNPTFAKGTQVIEMLLFSNKVVITTVAATAYSTVQNITAALFNNFSDFAGIFDEYRMTGGYVDAYPVAGPGASALLNGFCVAAIDYGVASSFSTQDAAVSHDNKQFFFLAYNPTQQMDTMHGVASWPIEFEKLPDEQWTPTTTSNTVVAYWKPYMEGSNSPGSGVQSVVVFAMKFQFRGLAA